MMTKILGFVDKCELDYAAHRNRHLYPVWRSFIEVVSACKTMSELQGSRWPFTGPLLIATIRDYRRLHA